MFELIKLSEMPKISCHILRNPTNTRPALRVIEADGVRAVVKDYSANGFVFRNTIGRFLVRRECRAYRQLDRIRGVPAFLGIREGLAVFLEEIKGNDLGNIAHGSKLPDDFFRELSDLVDRVHNRGLAHCDLKRAPNTILGNDGKPYIVDWSASISEKEFKLFPLNLIYKRFIKDDKNAIIKLMLKFRPEDVTPEQREQYLHRSRIEKCIRSFRDEVRRLIKKVA
jgi:RIO-like serine/threonine protein kinase